MNKRPLLRLCCLLCACILLSGCAAPENAPAVQVTLPPVVSRREVPENDMNQEYEQTVLLYLPSLDGTRLLAVPRTARLIASRHSAEALCDLLLSQKATDTTAALGGEIPLSLSSTDAVEVSGNVATVSLSASALRLSHEELFTVGQALANTLCQFGDLAFVNVLIAGVQPGMDVAATLPAGSFQPNTQEELGALWARASAPKTAARRAIAATLYYPAPGGRGILCEARTLSFSEITPAAMTVTLLEALSAGAEQLPGVPRCPELSGLLLGEPTLEEKGGMRRMVLRFGEALNENLLEAGITRSVMMAALTCTLTTFLPGLDGIAVQIGSESLSAITPSGTLVGAGETLHFSDGLMRRRDLSSFLLAHCTLYFANDQGSLTAVARAIPFYETRSPRALLHQLVLGSQPYDTVTGLAAVLPGTLRDADLLGAALDQDVLVLNFSDQLLALSQGMDAAQERRMVYAMVNTLCQLPGVKRVAFYVLGSQPDTLAGALFLPGDFLPNLNLAGMGEG